MFGISYASCATVGLDANHVKMVHAILDFAENNESISTLIATHNCVFESATNWFNELTFAYFPYDEAFFVNEAISALDGIFSGMSLTNEIEIVCVTIALSYLPDPFHVMQDILNAITRANFPNSMRDRCNIFVSSCQMILSRWLK